MNYTVKYAILPSRKIYNHCGPHDWTNHTQRGDKYIKRWNRACNFYKRLEESVLQEGFRNPIVVSNGGIPKRLLSRIPSEFHNGLVCHTLGGSRLWVAQKHDMEIPCIINDFIGNEFWEIIDDPTIYFSDAFKTITYTEWGIRLSNPPYVHLETKHQSAQSMHDIRKAIRQGQFDDN
ncbi:MAG: hypothetical protein WC284_10220 [Candidimonas sp.]